MNIKLSNEALTDSANVVDIIFGKQLKEYGNQEPFERWKIHSYHSIALEWT